MSYFFTIKNSEGDNLIKFSIGAFKARTTNEVIEAVESSTQLRFDHTTHDSKRGGVYFSTFYIRSPETEGLEGVVKRLKETLKFAEADRFTITDEYGNTTTYTHNGPSI